jgi:hypothetical protein
VVLPVALPVELPAVAEASLFDAGPLEPQLEAVMEMTKTHNPVHNARICRMESDRNTF